MGELALHWAAAALVPMIIGFIWYNPKVFGTAWMNAAGLTMESMRQKNMFVTMLLCYIFSFFIAFIIQSMVVHQFGALGMIGGDPSKALPSFKAFMDDYGTAFRTFKHGMLHGCMGGLFLAFPVVAINAMFEHKSWKFILINAGFWVVCFTLMGGILCAWV